MSGLPEGGDRPAPPTLNLPFFTISPYAQPSQGDQNMQTNKRSANLTAKVTGYLIMSSKDPNRLFSAPIPDWMDGMEAPTAGLWAATYDAERTLEGAKQQAEDKEPLIPGDTPVIRAAEISINGQVQFIQTSDLPKASFDLPDDLPLSEPITAGRMLNDASLDPAFPAGPQSMTIKMKITDRQEFASSFGAFPSKAKGENMAAVFYPFTKGDSGFDLTSINVKARGEDFHLTISGMIRDPHLLLQTAALGGRCSGRDSDYVPKTADDAIFELFYGSNDASAAMDYGLEIEEWEEEKPKEPEEPEEPGF
jgi:hypothetical protein